MTTPNNLPQVERLNGGQPILKKVTDHAWENRVVFNPAAVLVDDQQSLARAIQALPLDRSVTDRLLEHSALCFLYYRAQGEPTEAYDHRRSAIGLAVLSPTLDLLARLDAPVIRPDLPFEDLGVEDPRVTRIGDRFFMFYAAYASGKDKNRIRIACASSTDLVHWEKHGLLNGGVNEVDNKNGMLFPTRVGGKFQLLHRPMEGENAMMIHRAEANDIFGEWTTTGVFMKPIPDNAFKDVWIGGGAPPILLNENAMLVLYHIGKRKFDGQREYDLGIAVVDPRHPEVIIRRGEPLLRPATPAETNGDADLGVNNVVFVCGAYLYHEDLYIPYAGADSVVLGARIRKEELQRYLRG
ncbi:MAG: glycosidase [Bacteroidota bacterium]